MCIRDRACGAALAVVQEPGPACGAAAAMVQEPGPRLVGELLLRAGAAGGILCLCSRAFVE